jgi:hypothetical protein
MPNQIQKAATAMRMARATQRRINPVRPAAPSLLTPAVDIFVLPSGLLLNNSLYQLK